MKLCSNCSAEILKGKKVTACKCGEEFFCSSVCYYSGINAHSKVCKAHLKVRKGSTFTSPVLESGNSEIPASASEVLSSLTLINQPEDDQTTSAPFSTVGNLSKPDKTGPNTEDVDKAPVEIVDENSGSFNGKADVPQGREGQKRDRFGRFMEVSEKVIGRSDSQKQRDVVFSSVTKWKKNIEKTIQKIQSARPEVSQVYVLETNVTRGNKKPFMIKTNGVSVQPQAEDEGPDADGDVTGSSEVGLSGGNDEIGPVEVEAIKKATPRRPANLFCFLCKEELGSDKSQRIVCAKKDCTRAPAHLMCLNLCPTSWKALSTIKCNYWCKLHRVAEAYDTSLEVVEEEEDIPAGRKKEAVPSRSKNNNFLVPQKLSPMLMAVLETEQRYMNVNDLRKLVRAYKAKNNLKIENQLLVPDDKLASVTGSAPFKINQVISVLQKKGSLSKLYDI